MEQLRLTRPYPSVRREGRRSYGGSQMWFESRNIREGGCGLIACADVLLYLRGTEEIDAPAYLDYVRSIQRHFPLIPRRGIDGVRMALGMNLCLRRSGVPLRARWCASGARFWERIAAMLRADRPAVISVGPNLPHFWRSERLPFYRLAGDRYVLDSRTKSHFVTVTGMDERYLEVSTWGRRLYIDRQEYENYARRHSVWLVNNLMLLESR